MLAAGAVGTGIYRDGRGRALRVAWRGAAHAQQAAARGRAHTYVQTYIREETTFSVTPQTCTTFYLTPKSQSPESVENEHNTTGEAGGGRR